MNGFVTLAEKDRGGNPQIGDFVTLQIVIDGKTNPDAGSWKIKDSLGPWFAAGNLTLSTSTLKSVTAEGSTTKLEASAMVHQPGALAITAFTLVHEPSGTEVPVHATQLSVEVPAVAAEQSPPAWFLPPVPFGGWNFFLIGLLILAILIGLYFLLRRYWNRLPGRKKLNHYQVALQELQGLQKYARSKKEMKQEEWKKFSFELAGLIRRFADQNFLLDSRDMTDREFLAELRLYAKAAPHVNALGNLLGTIDEVRYGKKELDATVVPGLLVEAKSFIARTYQPAEGEKGE